MTDIFGRNDQFRCCMYLHVRTGTIILGVLHILLQLVVVSTLLMAALKHDVATLKSPFDVVTTNNCQPQSSPGGVFYMLMHVVPGFTIFHQSHSDLVTRFPTGNTSEPDSSKTGRIINLLLGETNDLPKEAKLDDEISPKDDVSTSSGHEIVKLVPPKALGRAFCADRRTNTYFSLCLALISLAFGYLLVHGVISRQPAHLLPFFCLQVFDFVVALICMLGYMTSASDISHWLKFKIASQEGAPASSIHLNSTSVSLILISTSCLILAFKAYCIGMVWDCHRYLLITNRHGFQPDLSPLSSISRFSFAPFFGRRSLLFIRRGGRGDSGSGNVQPDRASLDGTTGVFFNDVPTEPPKDSTLPKYEEALSIPANAFAPPPYFASRSKEETNVALDLVSSTNAASGASAPGRNVAGSKENVDSSTGSNIV